MPQPFQNRFFIENTHLKLFCRGTTEYKGLKDPEKINLYKPILKSIIDYDII